MVTEKQPLVKVSGQLFWAKDMQTLATAFNTPTSINDKFYCTIGCLSSDAVKALAEIGVMAKQDEKYPDQGYYIKSKSLFKFDPKDTAGNVLESAVLGNGTKVTAGISTYTTKFAKQSFLQPAVKYVIVKEIVTYTPEPKAEEELDDVL
jgi:hypothetical protein